MDIKFEYLPEELSEVLKSFDIKEKDLFNHHSDLYVGCKDYATAKHIKEGGIWNALSNIFNPQKGSSMDKYPYGVDIGFALMDYMINSKRKNHEIQNG